MELYYIALPGSVGFHFIETCMCMYMYIHCMYVCVCVCMYTEIVFLRMICNTKNAYYSIECMHCTLMCMYVH